MLIRQWYSARCACMYKYKLAILVTSLVTHECERSREFNDIGARIMVFVHKIEAAAPGEPVAAAKITKPIRPKEEVESHPRCN